jgi:hypothetical protein
VVAVDREHVVVLQVAKALAEGQLLGRLPRLPPSVDRLEKDRARLALAGTPRGAAQDGSAVVQKAHGRVAGAVVERWIAALGCHAAEPARAPRPAAVDRVSEAAGAARAVVVPGSDEILRVRGIDRDVDLIAAIVRRPIVADVRHHADSRRPGACGQHEDDEEQRQHQTKPLRHSPSSGRIFAGPAGPRALRGAGAAGEQAHLLVSTAPCYSDISRYPRYHRCQRPGRPGQATLHLLGPAHWVPWRGSLLLGCRTSFGIPSPTSGSPRVAPRPT